MTLETSIANIKIINNTIDKGAFDTTSGPVIYNYTFHAWIFGSSNIDNNTFIGPATSSDMLNIDNCSCVITKNKFIRNSTTINSYIRIYGPEDQIVKDNFFDQPTIDGLSDDKLVKGISSLSQYFSNKNQTIYVPISMSGGTFATDPANSGDIVSDTSSSVSNFANYLQIFVNTVNPRTYIFNFDLNSALPSGVQILELKQGIYNLFVGSGTVDGFLSVSINVDNVIPANYAAGVNSILDVKYSTLGGSPIELIFSQYSFTGNLTALQAATQYVTVDATSNNIQVSDPKNFINTSDKCMTLQVFLYNDINVLGGGQDWRLSPIVVKCRWP